MGKKRHSQDKLWITNKEMVQDWGGKSEENYHKNTSVQKLPYYCCSLTFMPFTDPVCLPDGTIFDIINILPYIRKFKKNPITGLPLKVSELIKLNFHKNPEGEYHCPITYKSFTENSTIIAIKETGNVFSYEAYEELNKKPKNYKDLLSDIKFDPKNIIIIQDPKNTRDVQNFDFIKNREDIEFIKNGQENFLNKKENFVNLSSTYMDIINKYEENASEEQMKRSEVLNMINNGQNIEKEDERIKKIKIEYENYLKNLHKLDKDIENIEGSDFNLNFEENIKNVQNFKKYFRISTNCYIYHIKQKSILENNKILQKSDISQKNKNNLSSSVHETFTEGKASMSFTSTNINLHLNNKMRNLSDDEIRKKYLYNMIKGKSNFKGYVRMITNYGFLNLQIHCDLVPKTAENFLELCETGYYNNVLIHRLIKGFVMQGGDPSGTGEGGISIFGKSFEDEFNSKLLHSERGVMSMANSGKNTNGSQFFIMFKPAPHLDNKHSVFGEVVGNIKILDTIEEVGADKAGKPNKEIKILSMEVITNPFRDLISDVLLKEYSEKFMDENMVKNLEKEKRIEEKLKNYDKLKNENKMLGTEGLNIGEEQNEIGKYLNKKREIDNYSENIFSAYNNDPYVYDKPSERNLNKNNTNNLRGDKKEFNFSDW